MIINKLTTAIIYTLYLPLSCILLEIRESVWFLYRFLTKQIDPMLPCVCLVIDHR